MRPDVSLAQECEGVCFGLDVVVSGMGVRRWWNVLCLPLFRSWSSPLFCLSFSPASRCSPSSAPADKCNFPAGVYVTLFRKYRTYPFPSLALIVVWLKKYPRTILWKREASQAQNSSGRVYSLLKLVLCTVEPSNLQISSMSAVIVLGGFTMAWILTCSRFPTCSICFVVRIGTSYRPIFHFSSRRRSFVQTCLWYRDHASKPRRMTCFIVDLTELVPYCCEWTPPLK